MASLIRKQAHVSSSTDFLWFARRLSQIEKVLKEHEAWRDLHRLVRSNCDRDELLLLLVLIGPYSAIADSPGMRLQFDRHKLKTLIGRLQRCADEIERLFPHRLNLPLPISVPGADLLSDVPLNLRFYAQGLLHLFRFKEFRVRSHFYRQLASAALIHYVKQKTGTFHDKEVSALISAVLDRPNYGAQNHIQRRRENREIVSGAVTSFTSVPQFGRHVTSAVSPKSKR